MDHKTILLVGCGNMGKAMVHAFLAVETLRYQIHIVDPHMQSVDEFKTASNSISLYANRENLPSDLSPNYVIFAIKPQLFEEVAPLYRTYQQSLFLSIMTGIPIQRFQEVLGASIKVIRFMPNLPMMIGKGATGGFMNANCTAQDQKEMETLYEKSGLLAWLDEESQFEAVTALSGSGPAFIFAMAESMISAGTKIGLSQELSEQLAKQTILGAACLLTESDKDPGTLRQNVTSPKGTTEAGLSVLCKPETGLADLILQTLIATKNRAIELSKP
ncbi:MAG: pyrroline-5-carboxylate reductase [Alphaproteobacteria bacterium]|jgi:pyrroline-5-carboxylate reductase|nr:pyrroline-5-carboxylate reductase [Alphaproteobacteria bacterium]MBP9877697.1 pyrroline-5-carboxylate reductase [Alphaproteobacteria bacterium]